MVRNANGSLYLIRAVGPDGAEVAEWGAEDIDEVIAKAREVAVSDPYDDRLPPDWAFASVALEG